MLSFFFQNDTFHVRWAYSEQDPLKEPADLSQLPPMSRSGSRSLHLFESTHTFNQKTADALQWMVQSNSVKLPAKHTLYWCTMLKLPEMPGKHHMIGYRPNIAEENRRYVHHMMLYECHDEVHTFLPWPQILNLGYLINTPYVYFFSRKILICVLDTVHSLKNPALCVFCCKKISRTNLPLSIF